MRRNLCFYRTNRNSQKLQLTVRLCNQMFTVYSYDRYVSRTDCYFKVQKEFGLFRDLHIYFTSYISVHFVLKIS
jgi:hypothetical protein